LIGKHWLFRTNYVLIYSVIIKLISDGLFTTVTPDTFGRALGLGFMAMFGMGLMLVSLIVAVQLASEDRHLGLATLVLGSIRSIGGSVAITIFTSIMMNTVKKDAGTRVAKKVVPMGAPVSSLKALVTALLGGRAAEALKAPGITPSILKAAAETAKWSWSMAFQ
jgi:hypothetical protein